MSTRIGHVAWLELGGQAGRGDDRVEALHVGIVDGGGVSVGKRAVPHREPHLGSGVGGGAGPGRGTLAGLLARPWSS